MTKPKRTNATMTKPMQTNENKKKTEDMFIPIKVDAMFSRVMKNEKACIQTLEAILGFEIEKIEYVNQNQEIDTGIKNKGIRADIYAKEDGRVYDIEMQNYSDLDLVKRMRYYQSTIDTNELKKGIPYRNLPQTFIIFICTFDMLKKNHAKYEFEVNCINHNDVEADFGQHFIALNTTAYSNLEDGSLRSLLEYINDGTVNSDKLSKTLDELVKDANKDKEWVSGVWEGISKEETLVMEIDSYKQEVEEIQAALLASDAAREAEAKARAEAEAARVAEAKVRAAEAKARAEAEAARVAEAKARKAEIKFTNTLLDQNRIDDLKRASKDPKFKQKLMKELGI